jgi:Skp family chaperone for outer membrane proteins
MRKILIPAAVSLAAIAAPTAASAQRAPAAVVVVVDTNRIYGECNACKTAQASLTSQINALQTRKQTLAGQLQPEGQSIQAAINALNGKDPDAALKARVQAFQKKEQDAQDELEKGQNNIQSIRQNVLQQINAKLDPAINSVMTQRGANLAVDVEATLAHGTTVDVTDAVLAAVNATLPSVSLTPLPQQPSSAGSTQGR